MTAFEGVRSVVYPARDLPAAVEAWRAALGRGPIWESPDYAAFDAGHGTEIGLSRLPWFDHPVTFWKVADIEAACPGASSRCCGSARAGWSG